MDISTILSKHLLGSLLAVSLPLAAHSQQLIDFSDLSLPPESFYNGADMAGGFTSGGVFFNNHYHDTFFSWGGWAYSNTTDIHTPGFGNQYSAITGNGLGTNGIYAIGYVDTFTPAIPTIDLGTESRIAGISVTNTTYTFLTIRDGDGFSQKFGGAEGNDPDFFKLTITGLDSTQNQTGSVDFFLADFRFEDNSLDYIVDDWTWIDLSGFNPTTRFLEFHLESSDTGIYGMNTPAYFALGELALIPEPSTWSLITGLLVSAAIWFRRRR